MKVGRVKILAALVLVAIATILVTSRFWQAPDAERQRVYGNIDVREVQLAFRTFGRLHSLHAEEGDSVVQGDVLARLDSEPAEEALAVAEANVAEAAARLASLSAGARPQEIEQARAQVRDVRATFDNAQRDAERQALLLESQSTSRTAADTALALRERAAAQLESAEEALALVEAGARHEDILAAEAALSAAEARLAQAATTVADTELIAPASGIIMTRAREPGSLLSIGQTVYALALTDRVYVRAYIDEPRLGSVAPGTGVVIHTDSSDKRYEGQIGFVSPQAEFTPKTVQTPELRTDLVYRLRIIVTNADDDLRQGMPVTVELPGAAVAQRRP